MHSYVRIIFLSMHILGDKTPVTLKRCPLSSSWNICTKNILSSIWLVTEHCYPSTHIRAEREEEEDREGKTDRERENRRDALFLAFLGRLYLFGSSPPPRWEDDCPKSFSQRSSGCNQPLWPHPHHIRDSALWSQRKDRVWKIPCHGQKDEYMGVYTEKDISGWT